MPSSTPHPNTGPRRHREAVYTGKQCASGLLAQSKYRSDNRGVLDNTNAIEYILLEFDAWSSPDTGQSASGGYLRRAIHRSHVDAFQKRVRIAFRRDPTMPKILLPRAEAPYNPISTSMVLFLASFSD